MTPLLVLSTVPDAEIARAIATALVDQGLAACVNILPGLSSIYVWEGRVEEASEQMLLIKTSREKWDAMQAALTKLHPYECPEIVAVKPDRIGAKYTEWWREAMP